jgi:ABC-2 type transport system permease protein
MLQRYFSDLWLLLALRSRVGWNTFRGQQGWQQALQIIGTLAGVGFGGFFTATIGFGLGYVERRRPDLELAAALPGLSLTVVGVLVLFSSFGLALGSLLLADDLETLMTAPVDRRAVFTSKLLNGLWLYYGLAAIIGLIPLTAFGITVGYNPAFYVLTALALIMAPLLPVGIGSLLVLLVARFAPARRVREVLGLVGALVGMSCGLLGQTSRFWAERFQGSNDSPEAFFATVRELAALPLPSFIAGRGLAAAGEGRWQVAAGELTLYLLLTLGFFAGCIVVADRLYASGWVRMQGSGTARRSRARSAREGAHIGWLGRAPAWAAIALKDWRVIPRDLRNFAQLLAPLLLLPVLYLNLLGTRRNARNPTDFFERVSPRTLDPANIAIAVGVLTATVLVFRRMAATSISMEGKAWWLLKAAPVSPGELLRGKLAAALIPFAATSTLLLIGAALWRGFSPLGALYGWYGVELIGAGMLAIAVGSAVPWAKLDWDDPRKMGSGWGGLLSFLASGLYAGITGALLCLPLAATAFWPTATLVAWLIGPLGALAATAGIIWLSLWFGVQFLGRVGEA